jgi:hypothetical protein
MRAPHGKINKASAGKGRQLPSGRFGEMFGQRQRMRRNVDGAAAR